jgi:hypothetical protein
MRAGAGTFLVALLALGCVSSLPTTSPPQTPAPTPSQAPATTAPNATATAEPTATASVPPGAFVFDIENRSTTGLWLDIASDVAGDCLDVGPGQDGSGAIAVERYLTIEVYRAGGPLFQSVSYRDPMPFTLVIENGSSAGTVKLSTRSGITSSMPALTDRCPGG